MGPVVTEGSTVTVIFHLPTPALPGQVRTVDGPEPSSQRTRRALPCLIWLIRSPAREVTPTPDHTACGRGHRCKTHRNLGYQTGLWDRSDAVFRHWPVNPPNEMMQTCNSPAERVQRHPPGPTSSSPSRSRPPIST